MDKSNSISQNSFERWEPIISEGSVVVVGVLAGSTRLIEWVNGNLTTEGIVVACALNVLFTLLSNKIRGKNNYYKPVITLITIAASAFTASCLVSIAPHHALIIGLCNGALKEIISSLYKRYLLEEKKELFPLQKEMEGSITLSNNNPGFTGIIGSDTYYQFTKRIKDQNQQTLFVEATDFYVPVSVTFNNPGTQFPFKYLPSSLFVEKKDNERLNFYIDDVLYKLNSSVTEEQLTHVMIRRSETPQVPSVELLDDYLRDAKQLLKFNLASDRLFVDDEKPIQGKVDVELQREMIGRDGHFDFKKHIKTIDKKEIIIDSDDLYVKTKIIPVGVGMCFIPEYLPFSLFKEKKEGEVVQFYYDHLFIELLITSFTTDLSLLASKKFLFREDVLEKTHRIGSIPFPIEAECFICNGGKLIPVRQEVFPIHSELIELKIDKSKVVNDKLKFVFEVPKWEEKEVWLAVHEEYIWIVMKNKDGEGYASGIILELDGIKVAGKDLSYQPIAGIANLFRLYVHI